MAGIKGIVVFLKFLLHKFGIYQLINRLLRLKSIRRTEINEKGLWESWSKFSGSQYQKMIHNSNKWIFDRIVSSDGGNILEVGCGFGRNIAHIAANVASNSRVYGMDFSRGLLKKVERNPRICLIQGDAQTVPVKTGSFPLVFTHGMLQHVPPGIIHTVISELIRVSSDRLILVEETFWREKVTPYFQANDYTYFYPFTDIIIDHPVEVIDNEIIKEDINLQCLYLKKTPARPN